MQIPTMSDRDWLLLVTLSVFWGGSFFFSEVALAELGPLTAVLGAACCYGCAGIYGRRFQGLPPVVAAAGMVTCSAVLTLPLALVVERPWQIDPGALTWAALLSLALLSTALAYVIYFRILASAGATNLLLVTFLIPVSALILGVVVLGERPAPSAFAGLALIFAGLAAVDGRMNRPCTSAVVRLRLT